MLRKWFLAVPAALAVFALIGTSVHSQKSEKKETFDRVFKSVNIEYKGTKVWVPATFIVKKGERVKITLVNKTPSGKHGFAIDEFGVKADVANDGKPVDVTFTADKGGLMRVYCQHHGAHIGGQLLVLE